MFQAQGPDSISFETFLSLSRKAEIMDPGTAMVSVLREHRVRGINLDRILNDLSMNPCGNPGNVLKFLCHIASVGEWGANLSIDIR